MYRHDEWIYEEYFSWLLSHVGGRKHHKMLHRLYEREFIVLSKCMDDDNRAYDASKLREEFIEGFIFASDRFKKLEVGEFDYEFVTRNMSVLEVLVALYARWEEDVMQDDDYGNRTSTWFWGCMECSGLAKYDDSRVNFEEIDRILDDILYKKMTLYGQKPAQNKSLWQQLCNYFVENESFLIE